MHLYHVVGTNQRKKITEPKKIREIAVRKKMRSSMGDKPKDTVPREEKGMQEFHLFDPRTNIYRNVTGDNEGNALKAFYAKESVKHTEFKLEKVGLFLDKDKAYIGALPDSITYCKCHGKSILEVKCPYNIRNSFI